MHQADGPGQSRVCAKYFDRQSDTINDVLFGQRRRRSPTCPSVRPPTCQQIGTVVRGKGRSHHTIPFPFDYPQLLNCKRILHAAFSIGHTFSDDGDRERQNGREGGREGEREGGGYDSLISRRRRNPGPTPIVDFEALDAHFVAKTGVRCGGGAAWLTIAEC